MLNRGLRASLAAAALAALGACEQSERGPAEESAPQAREGERSARETGTVTGRLSFPSDYLPEDMQVCAEEVASGETFCDSEKQQDTYRLTLPPGRYTVWAQTDDWPGVRAFYSRAVPCGLKVECADHTPLVVEVAANAMVSGIDPGDWYAEN